LDYKVPVEEKSIEGRIVQEINNGCEQDIRDKTHDFASMETTEKNILDDVILDILSVSEIIHPLVKETITSLQEAQMHYVISKLQTGGVVNDWTNEIKYFNEVEQLKYLLTTKERNFAYMPINIKTKEGLEKKFSSVPNYPFCEVKFVCFTTDESKAKKIVCITTDSTLADEYVYVHYHSLHSVNNCEKVYVTTDPLRFEKMIYILGTYTLF